MSRIGMVGALAVALMACGRPDGAGRDPRSNAAGARTASIVVPEDLPPSIVTAKLLPARTGHPYADKVLGRGISPLTYSFSAKPDELAWLTIDPGTGVLSGQVPPSMPLGDRMVTVQVRDAASGGRTTAQPFALRIVGCDDGGRQDCFMSSVISCLQGTQSCADGGWSSCGGGQGSSDINACGASCATCGPGASGCKDGVCACGNGAACSSTTPTCCQGAGGSAACTNLLTDPASCGACGSACNPASRLNVTPTCAGGTCAFPCASSRYADCDSNPANGCEADLQSVATCGGCGNQCQPPINGTAACGPGGCVKNCAPGNVVCGNTCVSTNSDVNNCGGCGIVCPTGTANSSGVTCQAGRCVPTCTNANFADCDGVAATGCEVDLRNDNAHCGTCAIACSGATPTCRLSQCTSCTTCGSGGLCCAPNICDTGTIPIKCVGGG